MRVEVWSDIVCPWCYLGKRRLEQALADFEHGDRVDVAWRSFELEPDAPTAPMSLTESLVTRYGRTHEDALERHRQMTELAAEAGLAFRLDLAMLGNTFAAHRLVHAAAQDGFKDEMNERLLQAYFTEGRAISDPETLVELAGEVGIDPERARSAFTEERFAEAVRADEREAAEIGIRGVPFFVLNRRYAVSGAQPADLLLQALQQTWDETVPAASG
jgi:predicted DsbA family dithiol-disulfide isomerase